MSETAILERIDQLTRAVQELTKHLGARLTRAEVLARCQIHRNTLTRWQDERGFPKPGADGKWLLSEIMERLKSKEGLANIGSGCGCAAGASESLDKLTG